MDWFMDNLWQAWLGLAIVLGVAEMFSLDLVLIMVAVGAVAGMTTALRGAPFAVQAVVAAGASVAMLALVRPPIARRFHGGPELSLGHGKLVGQRAIVTETITGIDVGRIKVGGEIWTAAPYDEHLTLVPGQSVEVLAIRGATAYVHPVGVIES